MPHKTTTPYFVPLCLEEDSPYGPLLTPMKSSDEVPILKARTLLAFMDENDSLIRTHYNDDFDVIVGKGCEFPPLEEVVHNDLIYDHCIKAFIAVTWRKPAWHQPGCIYVSRSLPTEVFENFLEYSKKWMDRNVSERMNINNNLPASKRPTVVAEAS